MSKQRILIVEDEAAIADTLQYALETDAFDSVWVASGVDALAQIQKTSFHLIVLDVGLPDINGFDLFRQIRAIRDIPILFLTARSEEIDRIIGLEIGADDYVTKPFSPRELVARIKAILRRSHANNEAKPETSTHKNKRFKWDEDTASIHYQNIKLALTKSEYILLGVLLGQPGRVFSRGQLMDAIWQTPHPSEDRAIDTHIKSLRAKLRQIDAGDHSIETHRGMGYSLRPVR